MALSMAVVVSGPLTRRKRRTSCSSRRPVYPAPRSPGAATGTRRASTGSSSSTIPWWSRPTRRPTIRPPTPGRGRSSCPSARPRVTHRHRRLRHPRRHLHRRPGHLHRPPAHHDPKPTIPPTRRPRSRPPPQFRRPRRSRRRPRLRHRASDDHHPPADDHHHPPADDHHLDAGPTARPRTTTTTRSHRRSTAPPRPSPAVADDGKPSGPPGVGLVITGTGYADCDQVYFFFAGDRIGAAEPDAAGNVRREGSSVPGRRRRRQPHGLQLVRQRRRARAPDEPVPGHRGRRPPPGASSPPYPTRATSPSTSQRMAASALVAVGRHPPARLPLPAVQLDAGGELRGGPGLVRPQAQAARLRPAPTRLAAAGRLRGQRAACCSPRSVPTSGLNQTTLVLPGRAWPSPSSSPAWASPCPASSTCCRQGDRGRVRILPGSILVGAVTVLISRLVGFTPGYVYGLLAVLVFKQCSTRSRQGRLAT